MKLEINSTKKTGNPQICENLTTFLNSQRVKTKKKREIRKYLETNENENTTYQNLRDTMKAMLTGNCTIVNT